MAPTLRHGDAVAVYPTDRFQVDGVYVLNVNGFPEIYRAQYDWCGGINLLRDNTAIPMQKVTKERFNELVAARVAMLCKVIDHTPLNDHR